MNERIEQVKNHIDKNRDVYIGIGAGILVGVSATLVLTNTTAGNAAIQRVVAFKTGDITQNVIQQLSRRGHPGIVVRCKETGETFASIRRASDLMGVDRSALQRHLKGLKDNVGGLTFEILGEATK